MKDTIKSPNMYKSRPSIHVGCLVLFALHYLSVLISFAEQGVGMRTAIREQHNLCHIKRCEDLHCIYLAQDMRIWGALKRVLVLYFIRGGEFIDHCGSNQTFKYDSKLWSELGF
jgi:hypothetical protein